MAKKLSLPEKVKRLEALANASVIGRNDLVSAVLMALITKHHAMVIGPHGTAKSMAVETIFDAVTGAKVFKTQCDRFMTNESMFGPIDMKAYRGETGSSEYRHNTENTLVDADLAYLDEFMDAGAPVRRTCLGILNERVFRKGSHNERVPLWTAVATTNFGRTTEEDDAVIDRFLYRIHVERLSAGARRVEMLSTVWGGKAATQLAEMAGTTLSLDELKWASVEIDRVEVPRDFLVEAENLVSEFCKKAPKGMWPSDRRITQSIIAAKATAWLDGRASVDTETDLASLRAPLIQIGSPREEEAMATAITVITATLQEKADLRRIVRAIDEYAAVVDAAVDDFLRVVESDEDEVAAATAVELGAEVWVGATRFLDAEKCRNKSGYADIESERGDSIAELEASVTRMCNALETVSISAKELATLLF